MNTGLDQKSVRSSLLDLLEYHNNRCEYMMIWHSIPLCSLLSPTLWPILKHQKSVSPFSCSSLDTLHVKILCHSHFCFCLFILCPGNDDGGFFLLARFPCLIAGVVLSLSHLLCCDTSAKDETRTSHRVNRP